MERIREALQKARQERHVERIGFGDHFKPGSTQVDGTQAAVGKIVYAEFDPTPSFDIGGGTYNVDPSILVIHNNAGTTSVKNTKGFFKGLLYPDGSSSNGF